MHPILARTINEISKKLDVEVDGRIVILGASGVGKTALLQYMNGESIDTSYPSREYVLSLFEITYLGLLIFNS